jgi:hypothetical protein
MARRIDLAAALLASMLMPTAQAETFDNTSTAVSGGGSLRVAIAGANFVPDTQHTIECAGATRTAAPSPCKAPCR